uniref:Uncharacterized protein n=1 Tax=Anguilla anguilla TaxID=7936 RepID=A0A0E9RYR3_ANGAN
MEMEVGSPSGLLEGWDVECLVEAMGMSPEVGITQGEGKDGGV